jgi:hypothetical protein
LPRPMRHNLQDTPVESWRSLTLHIDQGSDGWAAKNLLLEKGAVICCLPDDSHRKWNNGVLAMKEPS